MSHTNLETDTIEDQVFIAMMTLSHFSNGFLQRVEESRILRGVGCWQGLKHLAESLQPARTPKRKRQHRANGPECWQAQKYFQALQPARTPKAQRGTEPNDPADVGKTRIFPSKYIHAITLPALERSTHFEQTATLPTSEEVGWKSPQSIYINLRGVSKRHASAYGQMTQRVLAIQELPFGLCNRRGRPSHSGTEYPSAQVTQRSLAKKLPYRTCNRKQLQDLSMSILQEEDGRKSPQSCIADTQALTANIEQMTQRTSARLEPGLATGKGSVEC
ncbi:hypothetical protein MMC07_005290 [Pseudocyphellaria aurata]|nr:hypothetical protein [Pseudocyphellaria aurata]